jgi:hypothetical protein
MTKKFLLHKDKEKAKPTAHSGTFVFARHKNQRFAKPKEPSFCENGNRLKYLNFAEKSKEKFTKKLLKNEHSETAQYIYAFLLAKVYSRFETTIYPRLNEGHSEEFINQLLDEFIIKPIEDLLGNNLLRIFEDEINGMIYFLMGNCHIKWN